MHIEHFPLGVSQHDCLPRVARQWAAGHAESLTLSTLHVKYEAFVRGQQLAGRRLPCAQTRRASSGANAVAHRAFAARTPPLQAGSARPQRPHPLSSPAFALSSASTLTAREPVARFASHKKRGPRAAGRPQSDAAAQQAQCTPETNRIAAMQRVVGPGAAEGVLKQRAGALPPAACGTTQLRPCGRRQRLAHCTAIHPC